MNIIKLFVAPYLILSTFIEWNIIHCMEEKESSYDIGARYYEGKGVEQDKVEAAKWFRRAAEEEGHITAQFRLAICYELGEGVAQDKAELAKWLQKAAEQGHIIAQFRTGVCYEKGEGVIQDKAEALKWFQKSADQGNAPAKQRVIKLKSELFGHSCTADHLNSSHKPNADISKTQAGTTNKKFADKGNSINNTKPITPQNHIRHPRQKNQKQDGQNTLSPEEFKKAEEAARKAMKELIAEEEAELRMRKQPTRGNSKKVKGKGNEGNKKEEKKEPISTKQITSLKKTAEKISGDKPAQVSTTKTSADSKMPTVNQSPQAKKQDNASKSKQKGQQGNTAQATEAVNNNHILIPTESQSEATKTVGKEKKKKEEEKKKPAQTAQITSLLEAAEKPSDDNPDQPSNTKISTVDKLIPVTLSSQTEKQVNDSKCKQKGQERITVHTTLAVNNNPILVSPETQSEVKNTNGKVRDKREEETREPAQTTQVMDLKRAPENLSGDKSDQISTTKITAVDKVPTVTHSPQIQKQDNDSKGKKKGQQGNTAQATQAINNAVNNNDILASHETKSETTNTVNKEEDKKKVGKGKTEPTKQITGLKKPAEKPSSDKVGKGNNPKISVVGGLSTITRFSQTQKQVNVSLYKQDGQLGNTAQTTQAINNKHILASSETQSEAINPIEKEKEEETREPVKTAQITSLKETTVKQSADKHSQVSSTNISTVDKVLTVIISPQTQKQDNDSNGNQKDQQGNTAQTTQLVNNNRILTYSEKQSKPVNNVWKKKATRINSTDDTNEAEKKAVIDTNQLLQADNEPGSINDHQLKPHKQKKPKALWNDVKGILKKKKPENKNESRKEIKEENNIAPMRAPVFYSPIAYPTEHINGGMRIPYFSGPIQYIQVPVPFPVPVKIPIYIPVPSSFSHVSGNTSQPWVPHTQIKYEDGKKIVTQWNDDGNGSTHVYHPDSDNVELEYSYLDTRLRHLKSILKTHGSQIDDEDEDNMADSTSSHIIHHGGDAAKQKNEELKKKICYLEKLTQEKSLGSPK